MRRLVEHHNIAGQADGDVASSKSITNRRHLLPQGVCGSMRMYVDLCGSMWMYVDVCGCMRIYADVCG